MHGWGEYSYGVTSCGVSVRQDWGGEGCGGIPLYGMTA